MIKFFAERKVTTLMLYLFLILLGFISWTKLPKEFMPNLEFPQLSVITSYENASSREVENLVTKLVEEASGGVKGVKKIYSSSKEGISLVTLEFMWGTDMNFASLNLREEIDRIKNELPDECKEPRIEKFNPFDMPVVIFSLSGNRGESELFELAKKPISEILDKIPGVAQVSLQGGREREISVLLNKDRLAAHKIPIMDVVDEISDTNIIFPAGTVKDKIYEYTVRISGLFKNMLDIENVLLPLRTDEDSGNEDENALISIGMLGKIVDGYKQRSSYSRYNGKYNISISVIKQADAYAVDVAKICREKVSEINNRLPKNVNLEIIYDKSIYITQSIKDLIFNGFFGACLAFLVILLFLRNIRDAAIVSISIPVSIFIALFLLYAKGITINTVSLAGIILGIGQLVDASIVVNENIARHRKTKDFRRAVIDGTKEVLGPIIGSISTSIVVFFPLVFSGGLIGQVFKDLSFGVVFSLLASLLVAFTLIPMLASFKWNLGFKKLKKIESQVLRPSQNFRNKFTDFYKRILFFCFRHSKKTILVFFLLTIFMLVTLIFYIPKQLFPKSSQPQFVINLSMPFGTKLEVTDIIVRRMERELKMLESVKNVSSSIGSISKENVQILGENEGKLVVDLNEEYKGFREEIIDEVKIKFDTFFLQGGVIKFSNELTNLDALSQNRSFIKGYEKPLVIEIRGHDLEKMKKEVLSLEKELSQIHGIQNITNSISPESEEILIKVNKDMLALYNLDTVKVTKTILTAVKGKIASKFRDEGKEIDIRVRISDVDNIEDLDNLFVKSPLGMDVPLYSVAKIKRGKSPSQISRIDKERVLILSADMKGVEIEEIKTKVGPILQKIKDKHENITAFFSGEIVKVKESYKSLKFILILAIFFVYMIMASEFESFWQPFLILFTIPMSLIGIVPGLLITGHKLSVMAGMGIILVGGLVVNNGIILIDFINKSRRENETLENILCNASLVRLRPILMTALTEVLGLFPLMLNLSGGSYMQAPMAVVVVWGLLISTILTLVILPVLFLVYERTFILKNRENINENF
ncbi:efflux RND transporter permease subunit [bacterium]